MKVSGPSGMGYVVPSGRSSGARRKAETPTVKAAPHESPNGGGDSMRKQPPPQHRKGLMA
jgi:hypothetical protein